MTKREPKTVRMTPRQFELLQAKADNLGFKTLNEYMRYVLTKAIEGE